MPTTLSGYRGEFTFSFNAYNKTDDPDKRAEYARKMATYITSAENHGYKREEVLRDRELPTEVDKYIGQPELDVGPEFTEEQIKNKIAEIVDSSNVLQIGNGTAAVYAYGYACCPDRLKVGYATGDVVQRIADQIFTSTPDKPVLHLEIKTNDCRALERAIHAVLELRGRKIKGGGDEWFKVTRDEVLEIYKFVTAPIPSQQA
jgi:hypothetical protein